MKEIQANSNEQQPAGERPTNNLADLPVTTEQQSEVKGGPKMGQGDVILAGSNFNHNETTISDETDEEAETEALDDLPVAEDQADEINGGGWGYGSSGPVLNHNETTAEDEEVETEALDDLPVAEDQQDEINGGGWGFGTGTPVLNHNETTAEDEEAETEALDDLPVAEDQADEVSGGGWGYGTSSPLINHNETTAEDEEAETEALDDLPVENDAEVKGGTPNTYRGTTTINNGILTVQ